MTSGSSAGRYLGDTATRVTSYYGSLPGCLLGTAPISSATGLVDSLLLAN
ncbi:hypothetical protein Ssi03_70000 [Sphaerisporangium siamense]|uniref:Uncharacterized protein n=1 Tax=Sphaerisporangium siamense TaxID=795645 RepID=A0A7W7GCV2_9ACTN|nr:hypothetical protein [Sphaerisporangium siamense]MBB4702356.1 hypothetical protein [Sphaerisporangium siamense]GII89010.1 hypothetical protein Ssi03_70000 [Sphaerisporangium siamense]